MNLSLEGVFVEADFVGIVVDEVDDNVTDWYEHCIDVFQARGSVYLSC